MIKLRQPIVDDSAFVDHYCRPIKQFLDAFCSSSGIFKINNVEVKISNEMSDEKDYLQMVAKSLPDLLTGSVQEICSFICKEAKFREEHAWPQIPTHYTPPRQHLSLDESRGLSFCQKVLALLFSYNSFCASKGWKFLSGNQLKEGAISRLEKDKLRRSSFGALWLFKAICKANDLRCCPYCNAEYVYQIDGVTKQDWHARSPLDHFFPKSLYPYLATALGNLIPCCSRCNSGSKLADNPVSVETNTSGGFDVKWKIAHPYLHDFANTGKFRFKEISVELLSGLPDDENPGLEFCATEADSALADETAREFNLTDVYAKLYGREIKDIPQRLLLLRSGYYEEMVKMLTLRKKIGSKDMSNIAQKVKRLLIGCELSKKRLIKNGCRR